MGGGRIHPPHHLERAIRENKASSEAPSRGLGCPKCQITVGVCSFNVEFAVQLCAYLPPTRRFFVHAGTLHCPGRGSSPSLTGSRHPPGREGCYY